MSHYEFSAFEVLSMRDTDSVPLRGSKLRERLERVFSLQPSPKGDALAFGHPTAGASLSLWEKGAMAQRHERHSPS
ncbi:hypothetical protein [Nostoc sp.]|uniref:hypothetical protein n=1 Tax=Nostoc sp. TaxID=1180 RepID=UPI002FF46C89